jgi:peroxiredoxin
MTNGETRAPLQPGEPAPDFTLPAINREGAVSLGAFRGKNAVLVALFRGLWCPFCRRAITQLGMTHEKLHALGVETMAVVATTPDNARTYFRYRPARVLLAADPGLETHRAFGLPRVEMTPAMMSALQATRLNPTGELPEPLPLPEAGAALDRLHGFQPSDADRADRERQAGQLKGQFLIDRDGLVRWTSIECGSEGLAGIGKFPKDDELLEVARSVAR